MTDWYWNAENHEEDWKELQELLHMEEEEEDQAEA